MNTYKLLNLMTGRYEGKTITAKSILAAKRRFGWHDWNKYTVVRMDIWRVA